MSQRTRRQLLEDSMYATAAALAGGASALGAETEAGARSATDRLGVAIVGARGRGNSHIAAYSKRRDTSVLYICDPDESVGEKRAREAGRRQGGRPVKHVLDFREALADPRVDIVSIATPNHWHALASIWAMQAGKDVYVEKPGSYCVAEGRQLVDTARSLGRICQVGLQSRSNLGMRQAMEFLHAGGIGSIQTVRGLCYKRRSPIGPTVDKSAPPNLDYDLWLGPAANSTVQRQRFHHDWHWQWAYGGGELGNQGIHQMDLARWGLNVNSHADSVFSFGGRFGPSDAAETADTQTVIHEIKDSQVIFEVRGLKTKRVRDARVGVIFEGEDGFLVAASYSSGVVFDRKGKELRTFLGGGDHFANFISAIRSRRHADLHADVETAHYSSSLCHTGNISYRLGRPMPIEQAQLAISESPRGDKVVDAFARLARHLADNEVPIDSKLILGPRLRFDKTAECFADNEAANALLSRDYRAPFVLPPKSV